MNIRLRWVFPTTRVDGRALPIDQIAYVRIAMQVQGAPSFTPLDDVAAPTTEYLLADVDPGTYNFTGILVDTDGNESAPMTASIVVPKAAPNSLVTFEAVLE